MVRIGSTRSWLWALVLAGIGFVAVSTVLVPTNPDVAATAAPRPSAEDSPTIARMLDPATGADELRRRLAANITVRDDFIAVLPYLSTSNVQVIPGATPFTVRCDGFGIVVAFTSNVTSDSDGLIVRMAEAWPSPADCASIALRVAGQLHQMLGR